MTFFTGLCLFLYQEGYGPLSDDHVFMVYVFFCVINELCYILGLRIQIQISPNQVELMIQTRAQSNPWIPIRYRYQGPDSNLNPFAK